MGLPYTNCFYLRLCHFKSILYKGQKPSPLLAGQLQQGPKSTGWHMGCIWTCQSTGIPQATERVLGLSSSQPKTELTTRATQSATPLSPCSWDRPVPSFAQSPALTSATPGTPQLSVGPWIQHPRAPRTRGPIPRLFTISMPTDRDVVHRLATHSLLCVCGLRPTCYSHEIK